MIQVGLIESFFLLFLFEKKSGDTIKHHMIRRDPIKHDTIDIRGGCRILVRGQLSDCTSLSGSNPLTNRVLNKIIIV
jgi:hypothetical protein